MTKNLNSPCLDELFNDCLVAKRIEIKKGWGSFKENIGEVFVYHKQNPLDFIGHGSSKNPTFEVGTVKVLYIEKDKKLSTHFHIEKSEIFYMATGSLLVTLTRDGKSYEFLLSEGDCIFIPPGLVHSMKGVDDKNILIEVSTLDKPSDSYRVSRGD